MTQEDKELLKDLSARLPYQVKVSVNGGKEPWTLKGIFEGEHTGMMLILEPSFPSKDVSPQTSNWQLSQCKSYLRPLSSMTEDELQRYHELCDVDEAVGVGSSIEIIAVHDTPKSLDYLNSIHVDYRGLILKDLAISTEVFNPYK